MASTRAKARALRDLTNIGITALEELGGDGDDFPGSNNGTSYAPGNGNGNGSGNGTSRSPRKTAKPVTQAAPAPQPQLLPQQPAPSELSRKASGNGNNGRTVNNVSNGNGQHGGITEPQMRAIMSLAHRKGLTEDDIEAQAVEAFGLSLNALSIKDASALIVQLQQ